MARLIDKNRALEPATINVCQHCGKEWPQNKEISFICEDCLSTGHSADLISPCMKCRKKITKAIYDVS